MNTMNIPRFTADASLYTNGSYYCQRQYAGSGSYTVVVPAIPFCGNCDWILDNCERNGWHPRAVCNACAVGNCFSGVEDPTPSNPWD